MTAFDDAAASIAVLAGRRNQAVSDHGMIPIAQALLAIAEAINGLKSDPPEWKAQRLWRAVGPDGDLWAESSDEAEVRERARPGDTIQRFYVTEPRGEWRNA